MESNKICDMDCTITLDYEKEYINTVKKLTEVLQENEKYRKALLNLALNIK